MNNMIHLQSRYSSLILNCVQGVEVIHWGERIEKISPHLLAAVSRPVAQARLDEDVPLTLSASLGEGLFSAPALEGHRNGQDWAAKFLLEKSSQSGNEVCLTLQDEIAQLELTIELKLDEVSGVLSQALQLRNLGCCDYQLHKLTPTLPLPFSVNELMRFHGRWSHEFQTQRVPFTQGGYIQENRRGRTSHENFPGLMVGEAGFSEERGRVWGFHLGWSGNHLLRAEVKSDGRRFVQAGELLLPGEMTLAAGESYQSPWLYSCYSSEGLNGISDAFHRYLRSQIIQWPQLKPRPVHLNTWEGIYFDHKPEYIEQMAVEAAEIGVERFIIDDGWFAGRNGERMALGDWKLDELKYPDGLEPLIERVNSLGMEFGLWVEPEMVNKESELYRDHPDWLLALPEYEPLSGRWQYVLNLQNPDCFDYLFNTLNGLLARYKIAYLKWDMNRELVQPGHLGRAAAHGQTQAYYQLLDRLRASHPGVEIESCSSGGGRIDFEVLKRVQRFWTSDCNDALERQTIQRGMSYFFPPEVMGAHIGPRRSHTTRRSHAINLRGVTSLAGHMGVELDPIKEREEEKQAFRRYIQLYKEFRGLLHSGRSFRLDSLDESRSVYGVQSQSEMLLTVCQLTMPSHVLMEPLRVNYLEPEQCYCVRLIEAPDTKHLLMKQRPDWMDLNQPLLLTGRELGTIGLSLPILDPESALLIHLQLMGESVV